MCLPPIFWPFTVWSLSTFDWLQQVNSQNIWKTLTVNHQNIGDLKKIHRARSDLNQRTLVLKMSTIKSIFIDKKSMHLWDSLYTIYARECSTRNKCLHDLSWAVCLWVMYPRDPMLGGFKRQRPQVSRLSRPSFKDRIMRWNWDCAQIFWHLL